MNNKQVKFISTTRNKGLEPILLKNGVVIGFDPEIHDEDAIEFTYKLPLGAIKRLIKSYMQDIKSIDEEWTYTQDTGSYEIRMSPYCNKMLFAIEKQLNKLGLKGKNIIDEVFNQYFKADYKKMKSFNENQVNSAG